jgi:hypothetical protein|uniref:Uncharacterized protein n=1 Tax=Siphoviridae sp. cteLh2 TaxID=2825590 RepID=A0A8S5U5V4_9CAUD|nr:hypothetical protein [uncultured Lachnoclostridium sp.]DAF89797.1 MAG TPA: hypothetical protein [Siphoviridae sp. cteLh2]
MDVKDTSKALSIIIQDIKSDKELGSLFQFWKEQVLSELLDSFDVEYGNKPKLIMLDYDKLHDTAIKIVKRIGQEY